jgi:hypothetical protein
VPPTKWFGRLGLPEIITVVQRGALMFEDADKFLKIAVGLGILAAGLGVGYHYAIYIPEHDRLQAEAIEKSRIEKEKHEREQMAAAEKSRIDKEASAKSDYDQCLSSSYSQYNGNWNSSCKISGMDKQTAGCTLPMWLKDKLDNSLHDAENTCAEILKTQLR